MNPNVSFIFCIDGISDKYINDGDIVIATAVETAKPVFLLNGNKGKKIYLIQGIESWKYSDEDLIETYQLGFSRLIAVSIGIKEYVKEKTGISADVIPNGIHLEEFYIKNSLSDRYTSSIVMLYHELECKGSSMGIDALIELKKKYPKLRATLFGIYPKPSQLPDWIKYVQNATKENLLEIYNSCAIYLCPSLQEGFGLASIESMACGCALVTSDNFGAKEFAEDTVNALVFKTGDVKACVKKVSRLIDDDDLRKDIATKGNLCAKRFDWNVSTSRFESIMNEILS